VTPTLTIGITTRNRPDALRACLESLDVVSALHPEVLVFDDGSEPPVTDGPSAGHVTARVIRDTAAPGYIVGRNRLVREASGTFVLLLDDDTRLRSMDGIRKAIEILDQDPRAGAVAFAQANADGSPWPEGSQPSRARVPSVIPSFIGFAHMLRRSTFLSLGGYRETFEFYGEEKDFCLRLIEAGFRTVYLPDAFISHVPDLGGRSRTRYLRFVTRNDCLNALFNDPWSRLWWTLPGRYLRYFQMRRHSKIEDPWGWAWLAREIIRVATSDGFRRTPVSLDTVRTWQTLRITPAPYRPPGTEA
jgi:GT2 family glycosyltransferase